MHSALFVWEDLRTNQCRRKSCLYLHRSCSRTVCPCETIACPLPLSPHLMMAKAWESWSCLATGLEQHECHMPGCRRSVCLVALCPLLIPLPSNCSLPPLTFSRSWIAMRHTCTLLWEALRSRTCPFGEGRSSKRDREWFEGPGSYPIHPHSTGQLSWWQMSICSWHWSLVNYDRIPESQNGWGGKGPLEVIWSCSSRATYSRLPRTTSSWLLNITKEGDCTTSLHNLCQCSVQGARGKERSRKLLEIRLLPLLGTTSVPGLLQCGTSREARDKQWRTEGSTDLFVSQSFLSWSLLNCSLPKCTLPKSIAAPGSWHTVPEKRPKGRDGPYSAANKYRRSALTTHSNAQLCASFVQKWEGNCDFGGVW